jgi:hypothetical protein
MRSRIIIICVKDYEICYKKYIMRNALNNGHFVVIISIHTSVLVIECEDSGYAIYKILHL